MSYIRATSGSGGGSGTIKDIIKDKVLNGGYTSYTLTPYSSGRCTLNEGGVVDDTTNKIIYAYFDVTINASGATSDHWNLYSNNMPRTKFPRTVGSSNDNRTRETLLSDNTKTLSIYSGGEALGYIILGYGQGMTSGERIISYGAWSYTE